MEYLLFGWRYFSTNVIGDNTPSSLSPVMITDILRNEWNYDGIVITDALNMGAIVQNYSSADAAVKALQAGADMLLMPENFQEAIRAFWMRWRMVH